MLVTTVQMLMYMAILMVTCFILGWQTKKNTILSIKHTATLKKYSIILLLALLAKFISFVIMYINVIYIEIISISLVFVVAQDVCDVIFEIFAITAWMQRYNLFFLQKISFLIILIWFGIELTQCVSWEIIFSINTIIGYLGPYCFVLRKDKP